MRCEHCGREVAAHVSICPACGAAIEPRIRHFQEHSQYNEQAAEGLTGASPSYVEGYPPPYGERIAPPPGDFATSAQTYGSESANQQYQRSQASTYQAYQQPPIYQVPPIQVVTPKNDSALLVEIIFSLFGLFGIGWLSAGRTSVGLALLLGSIFIYWPVMILGTIFTLGIGLLCLGPLAILAIIINALLFSSTLKRQMTSYIIYSQQPPMQQPPTY